MAWIREKEKEMRGGFQGEETEELVNKQPTNAPQEKRIASLDSQSNKLGVDEKVERKGKNRSKREN